MESDKDWSPAKTEFPKKKAAPSATRTFMKGGAARGRKKKPAAFDAFDERDKATPEDLGDRERFEFSPDDTDTGGAPAPRGGGGARKPIQRTTKSEGNMRPAFDKPRRTESSSSWSNPDRKGPGGRQKFRKFEGKKGDRSKLSRSGSISSVPSKPSPASGPGLPDARAFEDQDALARLAESTGGEGEPLEVAPLHDRSLKELIAEAEATGLRIAAAPTRRALVERIVRAAGEAGRKLVDEGILYMAEEGHGFIVRSRNNFHLHPEDPYVAPALIRKYGLRPCQQIRVQVRLPRTGERCPAALAVLKVMGADPDSVSHLPRFEDLVPCYPIQRIILEGRPKKGKKERADVSMRAVEILTPIGFGQRGLIVAPPRAGRTVLLQGIANAVATHNPDAKLIILLVDERPEEVTDFRRLAHGEVIGSTFDEPMENHAHSAEMVLEKACRLVEAGEDVVVLLDSITRLTRAYNALSPGSGKIRSGGVEATALQNPKRFFGSARNIENGGSLTILATALIETGSQMDEVIFEEFKGTGNMELHLDRSLVDKRIFPAINMEKSGTRKEELLYHPDEMEKIYSLRKSVQGVSIVEAMEMFIQRLEKTENNTEFLMTVKR